MENVYKDVLTQLWESENEHLSQNQTKVEFLSFNVFGFITDDIDLDELFASKMLEVIKAILDQKTFEYQGISKENYHNFILMCNMPFLKDKLEWGTSIRGPWFDKFGHYSEKKEDRIYQITDDFSIPKSEINNFISDLIKWANE